MNRIQEAIQQSIAAKEALLADESFTARIQQAVERIGSDGYIVHSHISPQPSKGQFL